MFIAQPLLAKLVHFQGYSHSLLSLTVTHVPSMHVSLLLFGLLYQPFTQFDLTRYAWSLFLNY